MKEETKHKVKQAVETLLIGIICSAFVISMNQSCSNTVDKWTNGKKNEAKKVQNIKNSTSMYFKNLARSR